MYIYGIEYLKCGNNPNHSLGVIFDFIVNFDNIVLKNDAYSL